MIGKQISLYGFRRGGSSTHHRAIGSEMTKFTMHHSQQSETMLRHYSIAGSQVDLVRSITEGTSNFVVNESPLDAPALYQYSYLSTLSTQHLLSYYIVTWYLILAFLSWN